MVKRVNVQSLALGHGWSGGEFYHIRRPGHWRRIKNAGPRTSQKKELMNSPCRHAFVSIRKAGISICANALANEIFGFFTSP